jgi:hypothetical protein
MDALVRRVDKGEVKKLSDAIARSGTTATQDIWRAYDELKTLKDRRDFVARFLRDHP